MTRDDIIRMARECGMWLDGEVWFSGNQNESDVDMTDLERFAALVAAAEREACAQVCEELPIPNVLNGAHPDYLEGKHMAIAQCAAAIRARGNHE